MHPAHHEVEKSRKRRQQMVQGRARGGALDRPGKKRADGGDIKKIASTSGNRGFANSESSDTTPRRTFDNLDRIPLGTSDENEVRPGRSDDEVGLRKGGEVAAAWEHVRRAYGGLVGGASEARDGQSTAKEAEAHDRRGVPLLSAPERKEGGRLTMGERKKMPSSEFALPGKGEGSSGKGSGSYPIGDAKHARLALAMDHNASPGERATIERKVHSRFPGIK